MGTVLLCARLGGMAVSAYRSQTRSVPAYRRPAYLLKSVMCERHLSGSVRAGAATFGEHPVYSTSAQLCPSGTDVDLVELLLGSCTPPGRIGWYRPLPGGFTTG